MSNRNIRELHKHTTVPEVSTPITLAIAKRTNNFKKIKNNLTDR